jgi:hypothetical protein
VVHFDGDEVRAWFGRGLDFAAAQADDRMIDYPEPTGSWRRPSDRARTAPRAGR